VGDAARVYPARRLNNDGLAAWDEIKRRGDEGLVAKRDAAPYPAGETRGWLKVRMPRSGGFLHG
jgi:ATP-dependent DNA ligase